MIASSRHLTHLAAVGCICLASMAYSQAPPNPDQDLSRKERRQLRQQERQGGGQAGQQKSNPQTMPSGQVPMVQQGPGGQGAPNLQGAPNQNIPQGQGQKKQKQQSESQGQPDTQEFSSTAQSQNQQGQHSGGGKNKQGQHNSSSPANVQIEDAQELSNKQLKKQEQQQKQAEEQLNKQAKKAKNTGDDAVSAKATPFVPEGAPPGGLSKKEQNQLEEQQKKALQQQQQSEKQQQQQAQKEQKRLDEQQKKDQQHADQLLKQQQQQAQKEQKLGGKDQKQLDQQAQKDLKQQEQLQKQQEQQAKKDANQLQQQANKQQKIQLKDSKQAEQNANQAAKQLAQLDKKQQKFDVKQLNGAEKAAMVGSDASLLQVNNNKKLSKKNAITVIGDNNTVIKNKYVDKDVIYKNNGYPDHWDHHGHDNHHDHDDDDWLYAALLTPLVNYALSCATCLPSVPVVGVGYSNLNWNYWDGHSYYDHGYADSMFMGIGHYRYNGCDGVIAGGRYYCYGYGWMAGCIDYGDRRIWCPGFWAPYTVEECGSVPIWIPPVYEEVWTGCCWETVQVDGGYFGPAPLECHPVTRYTWVPGHFEYAYV